MDGEHRQDHWKRTYQLKADQEVSWTQDNPEPSLSLVTAAASSLSSPIIDIGAGTSRLVDHLVDKGYINVAALDLSPAALDKARTRLGERAEAVTWIVADITAWVPERQYEVWHDRATFHFLVTEEDRSAYVACLRQALSPGGHAIIATFAMDGPEKCSGLPVVRYDPARLADALGPGFELTHSQRSVHQTPFGATQSFQFTVFRYVA